MTETTVICLEADCSFAECTGFAAQLHLQLSKGYDVCSVLEAPLSAELWREQHRTARKRADRALRLGYRFERIQRDQFDQDIFEINTSLERRQGRPMAKPYTEKIHYLPLPVYQCSRHRISTYGVLYGRRLVAYLWLYRSGELALVSTILGHGAHLENDVMYLLFQETVEAEGEHGGQFVYNRHDSGTDGLRYFKAKLGFEPKAVEWRL
jgi:hypothetical protein